MPISSDAIEYRTYIHIYVYLSGEGFAGNDEENRLRVELLQRLRHVGPVNVRHKVNLNTTTRIFKAVFWIQKADVYHYTSNSGIQVIGYWNSYT